MLDVSPILSFMRLNSVFISYTRKNMQKKKKMKNNLSTKKALTVHR